MKQAAARRIFRLFPRYWNDLTLSLRELWDASATLFFPPVCYFCKAPLDSRAGKKLCPSCSEKIVLTEAPYCLRCSKTDVFLDEESLLCPDCRDRSSERDPLSRVLAGSRYEALVPRLIARFKYGRCRYLADPLADIIMKHPEFDVLAPHIAAFVPVPMHWARKLARGFDQAEDLARELSRRTGVPVVKALRRARYHKPQASLNMEERMRNLGGAFLCDKKKRAFLKKQGRDKLIALVDDVCTTGTTAELCARALKRAGARNIVLFCVAKT